MHRFKYVEAYTKYIKCSTKGSNKFKHKLGSSNLQLVTNLGLQSSQQQGGNVHCNHQKQRAHNHHSTGWSCSASNLRSTGWSCSASNLRAFTAWERRVARIANISCSVVTYYIWEVFSFPNCALKRNEAIYGGSHSRENSLHFEFYFSSSNHCQLLDAAIS